ncbi:DUF1254 domain-containing protein [Rhodococcus erythropolis]|uniref:DUF1254 domain-containing protein n=1 Tax=Rhodococcus erythropolis TaxID=1833 RepID=UPI003D0D6844
MNEPTNARTGRTECTDRLVATVADTFRLGFEAYLWAYPLVLMARTRNVLTDPNRRHPCRLNELRVVPRLLTDRDREVVKPNNDTIYVNGWLDLRAGPVTLTVPEVSRYYSFQLLDHYTETWAYVGTRATGSQAGRYTIVGPEWTGRAPGGATVLTAPTNTVWVLGRVLVEGPDDLEEAKRIADSFHLTAPRTLASARTRALSPHTVKDAGIGFFDELGAALVANPPPAADAELVARLAAAGIGVGHVPSSEITDPLVLAVLTASVTAAHACLVASDRGLSAGGGDWRYDLNIGRYDGDHLLRAVVALNALGALTAEEAVYANAGCDGDGNGFDGHNRYVLRFAVNELPPVDGFWSLTMYDSEDFLTANPIQRFAIGDRTEGLRYGADGSLEIQISHEPPASTANWLPAPAGPFQLTLRFYLPERPIRDGEYTVPSVRRV